MMVGERREGGATMTDLNDGPERLSSDELANLIDQIVSGHGSRAFTRSSDGYWSADYYKPKPTLEEIRAQVLREQAAIDGKLRSEEPLFVITASGTRRVHLPTCSHIRHTIDREESWAFVLERYSELRPSDLGLMYRMPHILTRTEVEALNSYIPCRVCAPTLNHPRKIFVLNPKPMLALSFGIHHVGREVATPDGEEIGILLSHQRIITADGIRSITTTTKRVIEGDGTEKYIVAPKPVN